MAENDERTSGGRFAAGHKPLRGRPRMTYRTFLAEVERDGDREAAIRGLREAIDDARARLKVLRARQVAKRVPTAQKEKAAREARILKATLLSATAQLRDWLAEPTPAGDEKPAADPIADLRQKWSQS